MARSDGCVLTRSDDCEWFSTGESEMQGKMADVKWNENENDRMVNSMIAAKRNEIVNSC